MIKGRQRPFGGGVLAAERLLGCDGCRATAWRHVRHGRSPGQVSAASAPICSTASSRLP